MTSKTRKLYLHCWVVHRMDKKRNTKSWSNIQLLVVEANSNLEIMENSISKKLNKERFLEFIFGGKAIVTFKNRETGNRYTYRISASKDSKIFFVGVLYGADNESAYAYLGIVDPISKNFSQTKASKIKADDTRVKVFKYVLHHIVKGNLPEVIELWHEGRCGRCGRLLTVPESIEAGFGPECITRL
jgi:Family of unknown function (DUF6011)